jgi:hypothetical protein
MSLGGDATARIAPACARRAGALALLAALTAPASLAADCMALRWGSDVVLRGAVEHRYTEGSPRPTVVLRLPAPLCVQGFRLDGSPFRHDAITTVRLGLPPTLRELRAGERIAVRGELWWPASAEQRVDLTLAVKEVL